MKTTPVLLMSALLGLACGGAQEPTPASAPVSQETAALSAVFSGTVLDTQGQPVVGARVTLNGLLRLTNDRGGYTFSVSESKPGYVLDIRKDGYAPLNVFRTEGELSQRYVLTRAFAKVINPSVTNVIKDPASGIQVTVPAGSLVTTSGAPATGQVTFSIAPHGPDSMPGDFSARNGSGQPVALETVGAVTLAAVDSGGNTLGLGLSKALDVVVPVPAAVGGGSMPECVRNGTCRAAIWRFDARTGLWSEVAASPSFSSTATAFRIIGQRKADIDPADGLGTWNADIEKVTPACTLIEFVGIPLDCYNPSGVTPVPGITLGMSQMMLSGTPKTSNAGVMSSATFIALINLRASTPLDISVDFHPSAPAYCRQNLSITSTPGPASTYPKYTPTYAGNGGITRFTTGALTFTGYPKNSAGSAITFADVASGDHPCGSHVYIATHN